MVLANFDADKELKAARRVAVQSALVVVKGGKEVVRTAGQTQKGDLET